MFLGEPVLDYIIAIALFAIFMVIINPVIRLIFRIGNKIAHKTINTTDDRLVEYFERKRKGVFIPFELVIALYVALKWFFAGETATIYIDKIAIVIFTLIIAGVIVDFIKFFIHTKYQSASDDPRANSLYLLLPIIKILIWIFAAFFVVSNLGYDVSALLAGLGIGGVAIALASQSFLGDLLSFISIISDKPFEIGDYISVNGIEGTVKKIGIKSVRIERNMGEEVVIPNSQATGSQLHNYKRMNYRRGDIALGLVMTTPNEKLKLIPNILKSICDEHPKLELVWCNFSGFSDFAFVFSIAYKVYTADYVEFSNTREYLNYTLRQKLDEAGIAMAYPTYTINKG
jgi:small-conductance mechanosensitive channel